MENNIIIAGIVGLLLGSAITYAVVSNKPTAPKEQSADSHMMSNGQMMEDSSMSMQGMTDALKGKTGDDFDKAFIELMIEHHQGAIDMANLAKQKAKHDEIKSLADDIITAQTNEIIQMREWQKTWGYNK